MPELFLSNLNHIVREGPKKAIGAISILSGSKVLNIFVKLCRKMPELLSQTEFSNFLGIRNSVLIFYGYFLPYQVIYHYSFDPNLSGNYNMYR